MKRNLILCVTILLLPAGLLAQHIHDMAQHAVITGNIDAQPLLAQVARLDEALSFLGSPLSTNDSKHLKQLADEKPGPHTIEVIQNILDPYCLAIVTINPEERVSVATGPAPLRLVQGGWTSFLVKINNQAGLTA